MNTVFVLGSFYQYATAACSEFIEEYRARSVATEFAEGGIGRKEIPSAKSGFARMTILCFLDSTGIAVEFCCFIKTHHNKNYTLFA